MIAIIGTGMGGLCCAEALLQAGLSVLLLEKAGFVGGRMATRHRLIGSTMQHIDTASNHIVLTSKDRYLKSVLDTICQSTGAWEHRGYRETFQPYHGLNSVAQHFAASLTRRGARIALNEEVLEISPGSQPYAFKLRTNQGRSVTAQGLIVTAPLPQSMKLLEMFPEILCQIDPVEYQCTLVLLCYPRIANVTTPREFDRAVIDKIVTQDHIKHNKTIAPIALYAAPAWAHANYDKSDQEIIESLRKALQMDYDRFSVIDLKRWKYAQPLHDAIASKDGRGFVVDSDRPLAICSDGLGAGTIAAVAEAGFTAVAVMRSQLENAKSNM